MQIPTPPPRQKIRNARKVIRRHIDEHQNDSRCLTPHGLVSAGIVEECGQYPLHLADEALGDLVALGLLEPTDTPHTYAVVRRGQRKGLLRQPPDY